MQVGYLNYLHCIMSHTLCTERSYGRYGVEVTNSLPVSLLFCLITKVTCYAKPFTLDALSH